MKRIVLTILSVLFCLILNAQKIAVMQFAAGSGVNQEEVNGISSMFLTFFKPDGFKIIERTEVDRVITEQNFQKGNLTEKEMARLGNILNLQYLVLGDINLVQNQYNVDTRVIDVETARIIATAGMTFSGVSFRDNMQRIAEDLSRKLSTTSRGVAITQKTQNQNLEVSILYGYLKVFPNDLGYFEQPPTTVISRINSSSQYGYNTWRIPTNEEVALMRASALIGGEAYMVSDSSKSGIVRLVTDQGTAEEVEAEMKAAAEKERIEREERERLAEQKRIAEQKRLAEERERREKEAAKEREFKSSLSAWEKAYLGGLELGYCLKFFGYQEQGYPNEHGVYPGRVCAETVRNNQDYNIWGYEFYLELAKNYDINSYLLTRDEWYCQESESNNGVNIYSTLSPGRGTDYYAVEIVYKSKTKSKGFKNVLQFDDPSIMLQLKL